jgi:hypothetical protein
MRAENSFFDEIMQHRQRLERPGKVRKLTVNFGDANQRSSVRQSHDKKQSARSTNSVIFDTEEFRQLYDGGDLRKLVKAMSGLFKSAFP